MLVIRDALHRVVVIIDMSLPLPAHKQPPDVVTATPARAGPPSEPLGPPTASACCSSADLRPGSTAHATPPAPPAHHRDHGIATAPSHGGQPRSTDPEQGPAGAAASIPTLVAGIRRALTGAITQAPVPHSPRACIPRPATHAAEDGALPEPWRMPVLHVWYERWRHRRDGYESELWATCSALLPHAMFLSVVARLGLREALLDRLLALTVTSDAHVYAAVGDLLRVAGDWLLSGLAPRLLTAQCPPATVQLILEAIVRRLGGAADGGLGEWNALKESEMSIDGCDTGRAGGQRSFVFDPDPFLCEWHPHLCDIQ